MRSRVQIDTSHYAECSTLLIRFRDHHEKRTIVLFVILLLNFYLQTYFFTTKHSGDSLQSVVAANPQLAPSLGESLLVLVYLALFIGIGILLFKKGKSKKTLLIYLGINALFMTAVTIFRQFRTEQLFRDSGATGPGVSHLAFGYGILTLIVSIGCIALAFFAEQKYPKVYAALLVSLLLFTIAGCFLWFMAVAMLGMYLAAIPEYIKMQWIMQQPGYPYFNERFDRQQANSDYEPLHKIDKRSYGEMADIDDHSAVPAYFKEQEQRHQEQVKQLSEPQMDYTLKQSDDPTEMPGIEDIFEHTEPLPDPEPPRADDIPDTKWEMPEPDWNLPDINADIPDLPEIPDIPKL